MIFVCFLSLKQINKFAKKKEKLIRNDKKTFIS